MKSFLSAATFFAILATISSAAPLKPRSVIATIGTEFMRVIAQAQPDTDFLNTFGIETAVISITDGTNETDTLLSFTIPEAADIGASPSSICSLLIKDAATATGSQTIQLFSLLPPLFDNDPSVPVTFNSHPSYNQYEGQYFVTAGGDSTPVDIPPVTFPCQFGSIMQFVARPQNTDVFIEVFTNELNGAAGVFIEISD
jgi:hypothetical protein